MEGSQLCVLGRLADDIWECWLILLFESSGGLAFQRYLASSQLDSHQINSPALNPVLRQLALNIDIDPDHLSPAQWDAVRQKIRTTLE